MNGGERMDKVLTQAGPIGVLNQHFTADQRLLSFAHTNALLSRPAGLPAVFVHYWTLARTVILGMQDLRLPQLPAALKTLQAAGYPFFVRNSGGLGIVCDEQVLNVSLFLPPDAATIPEAYQLMADWLTTAVGAPLTVGEVRHSYCPGTFDLSLGGQKIAGLAQRRTSRGIVVMAYLAVGGDQAARGQVMADFYQAGQGQADPRHRFPQVLPATMGTLKAHLAAPLTPQGLSAKLTAALPTDSVSLTPVLATPAYQSALTAALTDMQARNQFEGE